MRPGDVPTYTTPATNPESGRQGSGGNDNGDSKKEGGDGGEESPR